MAKWLEIVFLSGCLCALVGCTPTGTAGADLTPDTTSSALPEDAVTSVDVNVDPKPTFLADPPTQLGLEAGRPADYFVPTAYTHDASWPVVLLLHGYSASGWLQDGYFGLSPLVDARGFILITPDGTKDAEGAHFWNGTDACCDKFGTGVDDAGYLLGLLDELEAYFHVDATRVYLIGHSNGAYMSFRLACDASDRITALVSLAGLTFKDPEACGATSPCISQRAAWKSSIAICASSRDEHTHCPTPVSSRCNNPIKIPMAA